MCKITKLFVCIAAMIVMINFGLLFDELNNMSIVNAAILDQKTTAVDADGNVACSHTYSWVITKKATCKTAGSMDWKCSKCKYVAKTTGIAKLNHWYTDANCTTAQKCRTCGIKGADALGHDWKEATCTAPQICNRCKTSTGKSLGHDMAKATCLLPSKCTRCNLTSGTALGHDWKEATCTEAKKCKRCEKTSGTALGHDWKEATCTEAKKCKRCDLTSGKALGHGKHEYAWLYRENGHAVRCERCKEILSDEPHELEYVYFDKNDHEGICKKCGVGVVMQTHEPLDGKCTKCGYNNAQETTCKHNYVWRTVEESTCEKEGVVEYRCTKCNDVKQTKSKNKTSHKYSIKATCTTAKACKYCGTTTGKALGHSLKYEQIQNNTVKHKVTCKRTGCNYTDNVDHVFVNDKCKICKYERPKQAIMDEDNLQTSEQKECKHTYKWTETVKATCTADGTKSNKCTKCGDVKSTRVIKKTGHKFSIKATCTTPKKCERCGEYSGEPLGHQAIKAAKKCGEVEKCKRCGVERTPINHNFEFTSCITPDKCSICGAINGTPIGHPGYTNATCTTPAKCIRCGMESGKALGHNYERLDANSSRQKCTRCGAEKEGDFEETSDLRINGFTEVGSELTCGHQTVSKVLTYAEGKINVRGHFFDANYVHRKVIICSTCKQFYVDEERHWLKNKTCTSTGKCECGFESCIIAHKSSIIPTFDATTNITSFNCVDCGKKSSMNDVKSSKGHKITYDVERFNINDDGSGCFCLYMRCEECYDGAGVMAVLLWDWTEPTCTEPAYSKTWEKYFGEKKYLNDVKAEHVLQYKKIGGTLFTKVDEMYHEVKCKNCDYKEKVKHDFIESKVSNKAICDKCGVTTKIGDNQLEVILGMELSNYEKMNDYERLMSCKAKGHNYVEKFRVVDNAKHDIYVYCTTCKIYNFGTQDHFEQRKTCTEPLTCGGCKLQIAPATQHTPIESCTEATICSVCGTILEKPGHRFKYEYINSTTHSKMCEKCGLTEKPEPHTYILEGDNQYCTVCQEYNKENFKCSDFKIITSHELTILGYENNSFEGNHYILYKCKTCNKQVMDSEEHDLNVKGICICGYEENSETYCVHEYDEKAKTKYEKVSNNVLEKEHYEIRKCIKCNAEIKNRREHELNEKGKCACGAVHNFILYTYDYGNSTNITAEADSRIQISINENAYADYTYSCNDKTGKITVKNDGEIIISKDITKKISATVYAKSQYGKQKSLFINVIPEQKDRISITVPENNYGSTYKLKPITLNANLYLSDDTYDKVTKNDNKALYNLEQSITWRTANSAGKFNTNTGTVVEFTPTRSGEVDVYASVKVMDKKIESKFRINVMNVNEITPTSNMTMVVGDAKIFRNVNKLSVVSNGDCVEINEKLVIAKLPGVCILKDEKGNRYTINVVEELIYISDFEISLAKEKLFVGDETELIIKVTPANATEAYKVTVPTSLEYNEGKIKALNAGNKTIKVKAKNIEKTFKVEVKNESLKIKNTNIKVDISNETYKVEVDTSNLRNGNKSVILFESSNKNIFDIKSNGTIIPKTAGKATLTVTTEAQEYKNKQLQPKILKATAQVQITGKGYTPLNDAVYLKSGSDKDSKEILIYIPGKSGLNWGSERDLKADSDCYYTYGNGNKYNNDVFTYGKSESVGSSEYMKNALFEQYGVSSVEEFNAKGYTINLAGLNEGGTIAIQMAHELVEAGFNVDTLALLDSDKDGLTNENSSWHSTRDDGITWTGSEQVSAMVTCDGVNLITVYSEEGKDGSGSSAETRNLGEAIAEEKEQHFKDDEDVGTVEIIEASGTNQNNLLDSDVVTAVLDELAGGVAE